MAYTSYYRLAFSNTISKVVLTNLPELDIRYIKVLGKRQGIQLDINGQAIILSASSERSCYKSEKTLYCFQVMRTNKQDIIFTVEVLFNFPTYIRDIDIEIMSHLNGQQLRPLCLSEIYLSKICDDNEFWRLKLSHTLGYDLPKVKKDKFNYRQINRYLDKLDKNWPEYPMVCRWLVAAAKYGVTNLVLHLLEREAGQCSLDHDKGPSVNMALNESARYGHLETMIALVGSRNIKLSATLVAAAAGGHIGIIAYLLERGIKSQGTKDRALLSAVKNGHIDTVAYLVEQGADIHTFRDRALLDAARNNRIEMMDYLIKQGVNDPEKKGKALVVAAANGFTEAVAYLLAHVNGDMWKSMALVRAAASGKIETVSYLIDKGAHIRAQNDMALREATKNGHLEIVRYLVEHGVTDRTSIKAAFELANFNDYDDIVSYLSQVTTR